MPTVVNATSPGHLTNRHDHLQSKCNMQVCNRLASNHLASSSSAAARRARLHAKGRARRANPCRTKLIEQDLPTTISDEMEHLAEFLQVFPSVSRPTFLPQDRCWIVSGSSYISYMGDVANAGGAWWSSNGEFRQC